MITNSLKIARNPKCQQLSLYKTSLSRLIRQYEREYLKQQNTLTTIYWYVEKLFYNMQDFGAFKVYYHGNLYNTQS